jgi:plasmid stabilization system protein ParE
MTKVIVCSAAENDYTESLCWYSERSVDAARGFDDAFNRAISDIAADPERFPFCDGQHRFFLMRRYPFRIIFRLIDHDVVVIAIAHASRSPDFWDDRKPGAHRPT